uniref:Uncharacterized protein n=1 Tax=Panagrolaimus sp. PS1159 TaxID=55785 RepID=A0AC35FLY3_9BILA
MTGLEPEQKIIPDPKFDDQNGRTRFASRHQSHRAMTDPEDPQSAANKWSIKGCLGRARTWTRFLLVGITLLCLTSTWSNILAFNFVMVCTQTTDETPSVSTIGNGNDTDIILPPQINGPSKPVHFSTSALCESSLGWPSVFYGHAIICAIFFVAFALLYRNTPEKHPLVTRRESTKISINKARISKKDAKSIPYMAILKTPAVWAVWIASLGNFICVNTVFLYSPSYFHAALGMAVAESGLSSALPAFLEFLLKITCGFVSDKLHCISETNRLRFFNSVAYFGSSVVLAILCFTPATNQMLCFTLLSIATALLGFTTGGFFKAGPIVARQYSPFVTGNVSLGLTLTMIFVPFNGLAPQDTPEQWQKVFWFMTASLIATNIIFCLFCSGEPAEWTKETPTNSKRRILNNSSRIAPISEINPTDFYCDRPIDATTTNPRASTLPY